MEPPVCQGSGVVHPKRRMRLANETDKFWSFACECGCVRAFSKPSTKAAAAYNKEQESIQRLREHQRLREREHREYSFGGGH